MSPGADPPAPESPVPEVRVPGLGPTFRHLDDPGVPWQQVKRVRNAAGTTSSVWEKWLAFSPEPQYLSLYARWDPGMVVRRHNENLSLAIGGNNGRSIQRNTVIGHTDTVLGLL